MTPIKHRLPIGVEAKVLETLTHKGVPLEGALGFVRRFVDDNGVQTQIGASWALPYDAEKLSAAITRVATAQRERPYLDPKIAAVVTEPGTSAAIVGAIVASGPKQMTEAGAAVGAVLVGILANARSHGGR